MKLLITFLGLVFATQFYASSNVIIYPNNDIQELSLLLSDGGNIQNGSDIIMENPGLLDVALDGNELISKVCSSGCNADFFVCYEADPVEQNVLEFCDSKCGFYVSARENIYRTYFSIAGDEKLELCEIIKMVNGQIHYGTGRVSSCGPKIKNGIVKLNIQVSFSECPVIIKNDMIVPPTTTSAPTTLGQHGYTNLNGSSGMETSTTETGGFFEDYWWIILILAILIIMFVKNAMIIPVTTTTLPILGQHSENLNDSSENKTTVAQTSEFFEDYLWIFLIIALIRIIIYNIQCCGRNKNTKKQVLSPRRLQGFKSRIVLQPSTETTQKRQIPTSLMQPSSILSHKSLLISKKEIKSEETDLTSMKPTA
uniref:Transmembrane protein n=1 Tax=Panagrolaimus sp. ES5 TaxID=591445 RepID=A0AC34GQY4_9BILA